jgi:uncharacterized protein (DUF1330 family)
MSGYLIVTMKEISNPAKLEEYRAAAGPTVAAHGGRLIISPRQTQKSVEGVKHPGTIVFKFPSYEALEKWYYSPEYQEALKIRLGAVDVDIILAEGSE